MENLIPPQTEDKKKLLYNPANWPFYSFLLTPIVPAIFYNRNSKILGKPQEGKKILMLVWATFLLYVVLSFIFDLSRLFGFIFSLGWIVFFFQQSKKEKAEYMERKNKFPEAQKPKEWPVVLIAVLILIMMGVLGAVAEILTHPIPPGSY